jgi:Polyketide cyclase / dehydrase and lipid transport
MNADWRANVSWTIESVREGAVTPEAVFALYADPDTWGRWGHNATWAKADGPIEVGGTVRVRAGYGTVYRCRVRRFEPGRALELVVRPAGLTIINRYEVEPGRGGCRVRHAFDVSGPISAITRPFLAGMYRRQLEAEVEAVIRLASNPDGAAEVEPPEQQVSAPERVWHGVGRLLRGGREEQRD